MCLDRIGIGNTARFGFKFGLNFWQAGVPMRGDQPRADDARLD